MGEKEYIVYKHTTPNNKIYIGITCRKPQKRWENGKRYKNNIHFNNAIQKYGWNNIRHEILFEHLSKEEACKKEIELIAKYKSNKKEYGYNKSSGGEISALGFHHTEEAKKRIAEKQRIINLGKHLSEETKLKISKSKKGIKWDEERKKKRSKPILCIETNIVYYGLHEAYIQTGINESNIGMCAMGKRKRAGGYHWRYYNESN